MHVCVRACDTCPGFWLAPVLLWCQRMGVPAGDTGNTEERQVGQAASQHRQKEGLEPSVPCPSSQKEHPLPTWLLALES